ncbi:MAG: hypothetical protein IJ085_01970 [Turicibacter sp.]|nr:hypothetical protein [Turicibacter sp.]
MAKKASTINIEENFWKEIEDYMSIHGINRNTAIEWMLLERRTLLNSMNTQSKKEMPKISNEQKQPKTTEEVDDFLDDAIDDVLEGLN